MEGCPMTESSIHVLRVCARASVRSIGGECWRQTRMALLLRYQIVSAEVVVVSTIEGDEGAHAEMPTPYSQHVNRTRIV